MKKVVAEVSVTMSSKRSGTIFNGGESIAAGTLASIVRIVFSSFPCQNNKCYFIQKTTLSTRVPPHDTHHDLNPYHCCKSNKPPNAQSVNKSLLIRSFESQSNYDDNNIPRIRNVAELAVGFTY